MASHILAVHAAGGQVAFAVAVSTLRSLRVTALGRTAASSPVIAELAAEREWDHVIASIAAESAVHRFLDFPFHDRKRLGQAVGPALEEHVPLSLDDCHVAYGPAGGKSRGRVLAAMTLRSTVDEQLETLAADGVTPERLVWAPSAILEVYLRAVGREADFVAVDLGEEAAVVGAFEQGELTALRVVRRTDDDVFVRNVGWSLRTIERLPDRIVAGGSRASDVVGTLAESLAGLSVEHLPFDPPVELEPAAAPGWRGLAAPLGLVLAMSGNLAAPTIDFPVAGHDGEPAAAELGDTARRLGPWAAAASLLGLSALGLDQAHLGMQAGRLQRHADSVYGSVVSGPASGPGQRVKLELRVSELENRNAESAGGQVRTSPLTVLSKMSSVVPADIEVEFESYNYDPPNVRLRGQGATFETVTRLQQLLDAETDFSDVAVSDVRTAPGGVGVVFELRFRIGSDSSSA